MALIERGHGTLLFSQLHTSVLTRLLRPDCARRTARTSWGQLNVKSPDVGWKDGAGRHRAVAAHGHMVALPRRCPRSFVMDPWSGPPWGTSQVFPNHGDMCPGLRSPSSPISCSL